MEKHSFDIIEYLEETEIEGQSLAMLILDSCDVDHLKELKLFYKPISLWCFVTCCTNETFFFEDHRRIWKIVRLKLKYAISVNLDPRDL